MLSSSFDVALSLSELRSDIQVFVTFRSERANVSGVSDHVHKQSDDGEDAAIEQKPVRYPS